MREIICELQQNAKVDDKFKISPIYEDEKFPENSLEVHSKSHKDKPYILDESVDTALNNAYNENSINDNYGNILSDKSFTDEPINSTDLQSWTKYCETSIPVPLSPLVSMLRMCRMCYY